MIRNKKNIATPERPALHLSTGETIEEHDSLLVNMARVVDNFGFRQILLPPIEERSNFFKNPKFASEYQDRVLGFGHPEAEYVLPPTHLFGVVKRYTKKVRAQGSGVAKWFYVSPVAENDTSKTRIKHEVGVFILGDAAALAHAQLINIVNHLLINLGVGEFSIEVTSLGCPICQKNYQSVLQDSLGKLVMDLCENCTKNLQQNPIAMWACEKVSCQTILSSAPQMLDFLDEACRSTFVSVLETLDALGISYNLNPILSGRHFQHDVLFQINFLDSDSRLVLGEGGNYSAWAERTTEEEKIPMLGFVTTIEKLWQFVPEEKRKITRSVEVFLISLGEAASRRVMNLQYHLQASGVSVAEAMLGSSGIKNQLKEAVDCKSDIALIIGQKEALDETVILRDMRSGMQEVFAEERIIEEVKKRLGK